MTSIEWLINQIHKKQYGDYPNLTFENIIKQATEMHKQEIIEACHKMQILDNVDYDGNVTFIFSPEQYYKETYDKTNG
jgi:hypothetical protein